MGSVVTKSFVVDVGIQWGLFAVAAALQTEKFYDLAGSGTFAFLAYKSLQWGGTYFTRQKIQSGMVMMWAARLGSYLFMRVMADGSDRRFNQIKKSPKMFFVAWTLQALWIFFNLLPVLCVNQKKTDKKLTNRDYIGWLIWAFGFLFEAIADYQKNSFRRNPDNAGKFINTGLWSISRHPNYFGEILVWLGLYVSSSHMLEGWEHLSVISPIFTTFLLTKVSGIPMLEASGRKRWGSDPAYQSYVKNTALLIPFLY